jgi:hypothetical protein
MCSWLFVRSSLLLALGASFLVLGISVAQQPSTTNQEPRTSSQQPATNITIRYQLPYTGQTETYTVTIAAAPADEPDWLISTFVAAAVRQVDAGNMGTFTEIWNGLDDNFMPVPEGRYVLRGIYAPAKKWAIDRQYHALIPEYVASPGDSWAPPPSQDHRFPPIHGHVFEPIYDISIAPDGKAVFLSGYVENWRNPFLVDLTQPVGIDQVVHTWSSDGRAGGQHVAYDGKDVWMIRFNEVYCQTNPKFGDTRTRRGQMVVMLGDDRPYPTDMAVARGETQSVLYICQPHVERITVLDGVTGKQLTQLTPITATAITVSAGTDRKQRLVVLHQVEQEWHISSIPLREGLPEGDWKRLSILPDGPVPRGLAVSEDGRCFTIRGRQVVGYAAEGKETLTIGKDKRLAGAYDPQVLIHPRKVAIWQDPDGRSRLIVMETGGPMRVAEWSCEDGALLRHWNLCQNGAGGFCVDPDQPQHVYATSLNTPELLRYVVNYDTGAWKVDAVWEGLCHRNMEEQFPGGRLFPQMIRRDGQRYLCFAGGAFRGRAQWMVYRQDGERWLASAACVKNAWWHDENGDGAWQENEVHAIPDRGRGSYWAGKFLPDLSIVEIPKGGHQVRQLKPEQFDRHGNPIYRGDQWQTMVTERATEAIRFGRADTLTALHGRNEVGDRFWDWSDATQGPDGSLYVAGVYKPDGITGYKFDEAGQVCAQWKLTRWQPDAEGYRMRWRVGRKAFGAAKPGEVYATMHLGAPVHGLLGMQDGNGLYHVFTTDGLFVDTLMYDRFRFGAITRGGMYSHSGGSYFGRHVLNRQDNQVYILMGRASNTIYRVPAWQPGLTSPVQFESSEIHVDAEAISAPPAHVLELRRRHRLPMPPPKAARPAE